MAQQDAHARLGRKESIADIVKDLTLLKVSTDGFDTASSMKKARDSKIQELKKANGTLNEGYKTILNDLDQTREQRCILQQNYEKIKEVLQETQAISSQERDDFLAAAEERIKDLENKRFIVLIAGETSAGKSSLINLLLNDQLLPTNIQQSTLTICEISHGPKKEAVVHLAKPKMNETIRLEESKFNKIKQYIEKTEDDAQWCKKIEIKIPNPLLKGDVVIVDSPGIGDSEDVNKIALEYLPQASAFIYVINSPNAGGLQDDRLMRIVQKWIQLYKENKCRGLTADSALFVCNKWDEVERQTRTSQSEKEKLQKGIICKLKKKIPELDEKSQVIKMSVDAAAQIQQKYTVMNDDLNSLIDGIQRLLPLCIERKTEHFYWWISGQLINLSDQVKGKMNNTKRNREARLKARKEVEVKLGKLKQGASIRETKEVLSNHVKRISDRIKSYFQSDNVKSAFCTWKEEDLPQIDDEQRKSAVKMKEIYKTCIEQRLKSYLQELENDEKLFTKAHADLDARFHRGFFEFEKDIREIDRVLVGDCMDDDAFNTFDFNLDKLRPPLDARVKKFLSLTSAIFMPVLFPIGLAAGVLSAPVFGYLVVDKHLKEKQLKNDACLALTKKSKKFLKKLIEHEDFLNYVWHEFDDDKKRIASIERCCQELIDKYEQKCSDLTKCEGEEMEKKPLETLNPLNKTLQSLNEDLMFDAIQHGIQVMDPPCQIDKRRLRCNKEILGEGTFGTVYKGKISSAGHKRKKVAAKNLKKSPEPSYVASFLKEAAMLMQLEHRHIVGFYGVAMDVQNHELISLALVFELCKTSLKKHIFENKNCVPWKTASAVAVTCQWSEQILDALEYIHSKKIVHRDLKLENVLISRDEEIIKLADLGVATLENTITGTMAGTQLYMAPEVNERKVYDSRADIYSFGVMMWEMWFGKEAPGKLSSMSENEVTQHIDREKLCGKGPFKLPPTKWMTLMMSCCHSDPCVRPPATDGKAIIQNLKSYFVK